MICCEDKVCVFVCVDFILLINELDRFFFWIVKVCVFFESVGNGWSWVCLLKIKFIIVSEFNVFRFIVLFES